ncbi:transmembrane protein 141 isoform 2-T2 [Mergus octosetaceus]
MAAARKGRARPRAPGPAPRTAGEGGAAMGNLGLRRVDESVAAKHPALRQYAACQSHAFVKGIGAFLAGSGAAFAVQKVVNKKLPYALQYNLLLSVAAGSLASYMVTKAETQKCSDFWIYLETGKSPQEHTMADGLSQPTESLSPEDAERAAPPVRRNKYGDIVE